MEETSPDNTPTEDFATLLENYVDVVKPAHGELLHGTVIDAQSDGILVDLGLKREGLVPVSDLERAGKGFQDYATGDDIEVLVTVQGHGANNPILSVYQARQHQAWRDAEVLMSSGEIFNGTVESYNRGGIVVSYQGVPGFVPASHVLGVTRGMQELERRKTLEQTVGEEIAVRVIEVDRQRHRLVLSQRAAQRASREKQKEELLSELHEGQVMQGKVSSVRDFGAFVDLGAADGLVHVSEIAWKPIEHPSHILESGDEVDVMVIKIDQKRQRIGLSIKQLLPSPWDSAPDWISPGETMVGRVTRVLHFGAFVDLGNGIEGLLHNSEIPDAGGPEINPGSELMLRVVSLDVDRQRVGLSLQELDEDQIASNDVPPLMKSDSSQDAGEVPMNTALDEDDTTEELPEPKGGD